MRAGTTALDDLSVRPVHALQPGEPLSPFTLSLSAVGHLVVLSLLAAFAKFGPTQLDQTKVYFVNLVPSLGVETPAPPTPGTMTVETTELASPTEKTRPDASPSPAPAPKSEAVEARPAPPNRTLPVPVTPPMPSAEIRDPRHPKEIPSLPLPSRPFSPSPTPPLALPPRLPRIDEKESPVVAPSRPQRQPVGPEPPHPVSAGPLSPRMPAPPAASESPSAVPSGLPPATKRSATSLDTTDFPFTYYLQQLQRKVSERWIPSASIAGSLRVVVLFEIGRDGRIGAASVERSSGSTSYDLAALRAVTEASPFPPLPQEFSAASLRVHFGFEVLTPLARGPGRP